MILPLISATNPAAVSTGESVLFWIIAPIMVLAALGIVFSRKAVHAALCMITVMLGLAALYVASGAIFLGVVQVVVYTGAVMMLILFVIMMVGVAASDQPGRHRFNIWNVTAWVLGALAAAILITIAIISYGPMGAAGAPQESFPGGNPVAVAATLFSKHMFTMELVAALLIVAALGAMTLTHTDRITPKKGQIVTSQEKMEMYATKGLHLGQLPAPGVYVAGTAPDAPAISGETGGPVLTSVPRVLRVRGLDRPLAEVSPEAVERLRQEKLGNPEKGLTALAANRSVWQSQAWGMPGQHEEFTLRQPGKQEVAKAAAGDSAVAETAQKTEKGESEA